MMWDNGTHNAYRYGEGECYDVKRTDNDPRILDGSELIEIGVQVERGKCFYSWISSSSFFFFFLRLQSISNLW